jgi:protoporphyrinogen oxidase
MILILGGGLTGLSTGLHLGQREHLILEREESTGGLCRSFQVDGFTFDLTGHLLHLRDDTIRKLVDGLLPSDSWNIIQRRSWIFSHDTYTPYPFQANTHGLPAEVIRDCLVGFVRAMQENGTPDDDAPPSFREWIHRTFGEGIARHFMEPFNEKLWRRDLSEMTSDWVSWSIPRPRLEDVVNGALGLTTPPMGYNTNFRYPRSGGIATLADAVARSAGPVRLGTEVTRVDVRKRRVTLGDGTRLEYDALVSTIPLDRLLAIADGIPSGVQEAARGLKAVSVINLNLGVDRPDLSDKHWIYFPEAEFPFYRVGFPGNFAPSMVPEGCSSVYVELSAASGGIVEEREVYDSCVSGLRRAGVLRSDDRIVCRKLFVIDPAYVIHDQYRRVSLPAIFRALENERIFSTGRFGGWEYSSMEDALRHGKQVAERLTTE